MKLKYNTDFNMKFLSPYYPADSSIKGFVCTNIQLGPLELFSPVKGSALQMTKTYKIGWKVNKT